MIYFHYCENFNSNVSSEIKESVKKSLQSYSSRNSLKGIGKISSFTGGIYVLQIKSPNHVEIIIEEKNLTYKNKKLTVYFIRGLKNGLADYVSIRDGKWLKFNILDQKEIEQFCFDFDLLSKVIQTQKSHAPDYLINWQIDFELKVKYNIFESDTWVKYSMSNVRESGMQLEQSELFKLLIIDVFDQSVLIKQSNIEKLSQKENYEIFKASLNEVAIIYLALKFEGNNFFLLINGARLTTQQEHWNSVIQISEIESKYSIPTYHDLCRVALRAYPSWALKIPDLWLKIEKNSELGNLSLLPEQTEFLADFKFPKYISGQAGSGKSTMLYYLFANTYYYKYADQISGDIIFLTENENLLEHTKKSVRELLSYNTDFNDLTSEEKAISNLDAHFYSFKAFLLKLLPNDINTFNDQTKYINFSKFKVLYQESNIPNQIKLKFSAEYVWFILSTYVYGNDINGFIDSSNFEDKMPKEGRELISIEDFKKIETEIIKPYYEKWINEQGYWDKIKLIKYINKNVPNIKQYDVIFCDEAQDFSKVELEFILRLSNYSNYNLNNTPQFPIVFAGDALQTVNPTGFKTEVLTSMIFQELTNPKIGFKLNQKNLIYEPEYNYRSSQTIVNLANAIQYERKTNLDARITKRQISKRPNFYENQNVNIFIDCEAFIENEELIEKIKSKTIIVPVNNNEIEDFKTTNPILKSDGLSIISAVDAKGIDFNEVVIYKFGNYYEAISSNEYEKQFFFNKLYVAITRAQQELLIIDDKISKETFWLKLINNFISSDWNLEPNKIFDLHQVLIFDVNQVKQSQPKDIRKDAETLKDQGLIEENINLLTLASSNYFKLGDLKEYYLCLGAIEEIKRNWIKAASFYLKKEVNKDGIEKAANVYLIGQEWKKLEEISSKIINEKNQIRNLIAKTFLNNRLNYVELNNLYKNQQSLKDIIESTPWRLEFLEKLISIFEESFNQEDKNLIITLIKGICKNNDYKIKKFLIEEFYKIKQYEIVISIYDEIGLDYENEESEFIKIYYKSNLEIAKRKNDFENIIIWLGSIALKTNEDKTQIASEIVSYYRNEGKIDDCSNIYVPLFIYFSFLILEKYESDVLVLAKKVEESFKKHNNENGLADEYFNLFKRNKIGANIQNFLFERFVKNAYVAGQPIELINENYKILASKQGMPYIPFSEKEINDLSDIPETLFSTTSDHISSIKIKNFRRFHELNIEQIGLFNLVVGDNNVGKTSFLEAMLFSPDYKIYLERLAFAYIQRANVLPEKDYNSEKNLIFYKLNDEFLNNFINTSNFNSNISFELSYKRVSWYYEIDFKKFNFSLIKNLPYERSLQLPFMAYGKGYSIDLAQAYHNVIVNSYDANSEDHFVSRINLFIPGIKRIIANPKDGTIKVRLDSNMNELVPLHQFGDGANKLFRILILLSIHKGARLMLDEIDSGIHHTKFREFWKGILEIAMLDNTQIIATTHNGECIKYFKEVLLDLGTKYQTESKIIQLEKINEKVIGYSLDFDSLSLSINDDIEIRGGEI